jgi:hypothetical protein
MMSVYCPRHGHEVLLGHRQVLGIDGRGHDMTVRWVCWCGQHGASHPRARRASAPAALARAA